MGEAWFLWIFYEVLQLAARLTRPRRLTAVNGNGNGEEELDSDDEMERQRVLQKQEELARRIASGEFTVTKPRYTFLAAGLG